MTNPMSGLSPRDRTLALAGAIALALLTVSALAYGLLAGRSIESFAPALIGFAAPTIVSLMTAAGVARQTREIQKEVADVHDKVNGNYSVMEARNADLTNQLATATFPIVDTAGRHHRPDATMHASQALEAVPVVGGGTAHAASNDRSVSGLVLPWSTPGATTAGELSIAPGGVRLPAEIERCKLHFKHTGTDGHRPVGHATGYRVEPDGLHMTFRVARTPDGDAAMLQITEGVFNAFSAELASLVRTGATVTDSIMTGVALVDTPAFHDARVAEVHAQHIPNTTQGDTMNVEQFIAAMIAAGSSEADARAAATEHFGADAVAAVPASDPGTAAPTDPAPTPAATPAPLSPPAPAASAGYVPARPAAVPAGLGTTLTAGRAAGVVHASAHDAANTLVQMISGHRSDVAHAALADITNSGVTDSLPPQWLGELWAGPERTRKLVPLLNNRDLRSWRIQGFRWEQKPLMASYAGDKAEIPTNPVSLAPYEAEATRWAGGHDLDRKFFDFGDAGILEAYWRAMHESYAIITDQAAGAFVVANATPVTDSAATDLTRAMIASSAAVDDALGVSPSFYLANPVDKYSLLDVTNQNMPAYFSMFGVDPRQIVWTKAVPAGTLIAGAKPAITFHELPGSPLRVEAEHLSHGGRDRAMFGYTALTVDNAAGIVKIEFAAGAGV